MSKQIRKQLFQSKKAMTSDTLTSSNKFKQKLMQKKQAEVPNGTSKK